VDFYGLPQKGDGAWPGRAAAIGSGVELKASCVEKALLGNLSNHMGREFDESRFVPFVVMHEFEGLLFSDCAAFGQAIGRADLASDFRQIRDEFKTPEHINDSPDTAPSKRVENLMPGYEKPLLGTLAVLEIGLDRIRAECPHFAAWLDKLESIARQ